jgi:hypothetical protein
MKSYNTSALPPLLYDSENLTIKQETQEELTEAEIKYMRKTAECTWTDYKANTETAKNKPQFWTKYRTKKDTGYDI